MVTGYCSKVVRRGRRPQPSEIFSQDEDLARAGDSPQQIRLERIVLERAKVKMNKFCGLISGLIGGSIVSLLGVVLARQVVYILEAILLSIRGLSVPSYIPLYSLGPSGAYFLIWGLVLCFVTLVLWAFIGISYGIRIPEKQWSKRRITQAWLLWGLSTSLIYSFFLFIVFGEDGDLSILKNTSYLTYLIELIIWWSISGIVGGVVSAMYSTWRCWNDGV